MKMFKYSICFVFCCLLTFGADAQVKSAMTFNIRYDSPNDGINNWHHRKSEVIKMFEHYLPDVIGLQEVVHNQLEYIDSNLVNYSFIGVGRADGKTKGEYAPIFFDSTKCSLLENATFWLSDTPDQVASVGWDASMERICSYGLFQSRNSNQKFYVFNAHYDHRGELARTNSSKLVIEKMKQINQKRLPVIFMGDLNAEPDTEAISTIQKTLGMGNIVADNGLYGPLGTWASFDNHFVPVRQIDYIFINGLSVRSYIHIDDKLPNGNNLSDHLPAMIEFY